MSPVPISENTRKEKISALSEFANGRDIHETFRQWLSEEEAIKYELADASLRDDSVIYRTWPLENVGFNKEDLVMCQMFLDVYGSANNDDPQSYVKDPLVDGVPVPGTWRCSGVRVDARRQSGWLVQELRRGFLRNGLPWEEAHIEESLAPIVNTNSQSADGSYSSDNPRSAYVIRWRGVDPFKVQELASGLSDSTYTDVDIRGKQLTGTWYNQGVAVGVDNDGSGIVEIVLGKTRVTLHGFRNIDTSRQAEEYYLYDVPLAQGQEILSYWRNKEDNEGYSARVSGVGDRTCNLVLTASGVLSKNLTASGFAVSCDTTITVDFAWGYTETEIDTWIEGFNSAGAGVSRTLNGPVVRGDGLYDATVITTTVEYDDTKHEFEISLAVGDSVTQKINAGWNLPLSTLNTTASGYEASDPTTDDIGVTNEFRVTRNDNCTFDYLGIKTTRERTERVVEIDEDANGLGIKQTTRLGRAVSDADIATLEGNVSAGPRKRTALRARLADDNSIDYTALQEEVQKAQDDISIAKGGDAGLGTKVATGRNVDAGDLLSIAGSFTSAARKRVLVQLSANDDETFNYVVREDEVQNAEESIEVSAGASQGVGELIESGSNVDSGDLESLEVTASARERYNLSLQANDDGTYNYTLRKVTVQEVEDDIDIAIGASQGRGITVAAGSNVDPDKLVSIVETYQSGPRKTHDVTLSANDDGTFNYRIVEREVQEVEDDLDISIGASQGQGVTVAAGSNVDPDNLVAVVGSYTSGPRKTHDVSLEANGDGTFNYRIVEREVQEVDHAFTTLTDKIYEVGRGGDAGSFPNINSATHVLRSASVSGNPDNTFNWAIMAEPLYDNVQDVEDTVSAGTTYIEYGHNQASVPANPTGARVQVARITQGDNGNYNYYFVSRDIDEVTVGPFDVGSQLFNVTRSGAINSASDPTVSAPSQGTRTDVTVSPNRDGTRNWNKTERSAQAANTATFDYDETGGVLKRTAAFYRNQTSLPAVSANQRVEGFRITDDEVYDYAVITLASGTTTSVTSMKRKTTDQKMHAKWVSIPYFNLTVGSSKTRETYEGEDMWEFLAIWEQEIEETETMTFSVTPLNAETVSYDGESAVQRVGDLWIRRTVEITKGDWTHTDTHYDFIARINVDGSSA